MFPHRQNKFIPKGGVTLQGAIAIISITPNSAGSMQGVFATGSLVGVMMNMIIAPSMNMLDTVATAVKLSCLAKWLDSNVPVLCEVSLGHVGMGSAG